MKTLKYISVVYICMVSYDAKRDKFTTLGGRVISPGREKSLRSSLTNKLELRKSYLNSKLSDDDIAVNSRAIELLCSEDSGSEKIPVTIGFSLKDGATINSIPEEHIFGWVDKWDTHGEILLKESDFQSVFEETDAEFSGFHVEFAEPEITNDFKHKMTEMYED